MPRFVTSASRGHWYGDAVAELSRCSRALPPLILASNGIFWRAVIVGIRTNGGQVLVDLEYEPQDASASQPTQKPYCGVHDSTARVCARVEVNVDGQTFISANQW